EIAFAGHPTIGSAYVAIETGIAPAAAALVQECTAGLLPIRVHPQGVGHGLAVRAPTARLLPNPPACGVLLAAACAGADRGAIEPTLVEGGRSWWIMEVSDESGLRAWQPDHPAILALAQSTGALGLCAFARARSPDYQLAVRAFPAAVGIVEDPASGAANGLIAALIAEREPHSALANGYRISQGREIGGDALIDVAFDPEGGVWVGGRSHIVIEGHLDWPGDGDNSLRRD
ncbi:MAG: PhzF family phenazine biosynthesis isomerase, partial [Lysobacterales bacterium]